MLHRDANARNSDPAAEAHENRLAAGLDQLYDIGIHADSRHRHNDKELGQRLERRKHACRYADRGDVYKRQRSTVPRETPANSAIV